MEEGIDVEKEEEVNEEAEYDVEQAFEDED